MGSRIRETIDRLLDKVRELVAPPLSPVPVTPNRPRR